MTASGVPEPWVSMIVPVVIDGGFAGETAWTRVFGLTETLVAQNKLHYFLCLGTLRKMFYLESI
jgi:hypothetical protein